MLHIVHHADYMAPRPERGTFKFDKYYLVMEELRASGADITEHAPEPMPRQWLEAVHDPEYVGEVFRAAVPQVKERRIGFPVTEAIRDLTRSATAPRQRQAPQRRKPAQEPPQEG